MSLKPSTDTANTILTVAEFSRQSADLWKKVVAEEAAKTPEQKADELRRMSRRDRDYILYGIGPVGGYGHPLDG